jgi:glycosyltransferase involved in cell wall biosynthesis
LKVLHFSSLDAQTGAGVAAARIHAGLLARGVHSRFCVVYPSAMLPESFTPEPSFFGRIWRSVGKRLDDRLLLPYLREYDYVLSTGLFGIDIAAVIRDEKPDIIHLHWIAGNSFRLSSLAGMNTPIVWRLSDQWPFCGLQHLEPDANAYTAPLPRGPALPLLWSDLSEYVRCNKARIYRRIANLTLACPSRWIMAEARRSVLMGGIPAELVPTSCDTELFAPLDRDVSRAALGLAQDADIVLIGATSLSTRWKGGDLFQQALALLGARTRSLHVVTFGNDVSDIFTADQVIHMGQVQDRRKMAMLYNAADVFVAPSRMENLANTVLESLACGTPVAAFAIGGMPDMIDHHVNGALADPYDTGKLAEAISWALDHRDDAGVRAAARLKITTKFSLEQEISHYITLYHGLVRV